MIIGITNWPLNLSLKLLLLLLLLLLLVWCANWLGRTLLFCVFFQNVENCLEQIKQVLAASAAYWRVYVYQFSARICQVNIILFSRFVLNCFSFCLEYGYYTQEKSYNYTLKEQTQVTLCDIYAGVGKSCVAKLLQTHSETGSLKWKGNMWTDT